MTMGRLRPPRIHLESDMYKVKGTASIWKPDGRIDNQLFSAEHKEFGGLCLELGKAIEEIRQIVDKSVSIDVYMSVSKEEV